MNAKAVVLILIGGVAFFFGLPDDSWPRVEENKHSKDVASARRQPGLKAPLFLQGEALPLLKGEAVKVTTWNLQWFPGYSMKMASDEVRGRHLELVTEEIRKLDSDILCLQEVKDPLALNAIVASLPEYKIQMVSDFKRNLEIAVLSKLDSHSAFAQEFHQAVKTPPRGFVYSAFPFGRHVLLVYSVHLKSNYGGIMATAPVRVESARQVLAHCHSLMDEFTKEGFVPVPLFCGDFNSDPTQEQFFGDSTLRTFVDGGYVWSYRGMDRVDCISWLSDGRYPDAVFDGFLFAGKDEKRFFRPEVSETNRGVSDHRPVSIWVSF